MKINRPLLVSSLHMIGMLAATVCSPTPWQPESPRSWLHRHHLWRTNPIISKRNIEGAQMNNLVCKSAVVIAVTIAFASIARADVVTVDAQANIYGAGHATAPAPGGGSAGILPPSIGFSAGSELSFAIASISGTVSLSPGSSSNDNGTPTYGSTNVDTYNGISGIINTGRSGFLVGVFLDSSEPFGPTPSILSFNLKTAVTPCPAIPPWA